MSLIDIVDSDIHKWDYLKQYVPELDYHRISSDYRDPNNIVGHQQRAFVIYWAINEHKRTGGIGLETGCGQAVSPYCIGTDFYAGIQHPVYGGAYYPHIRCMGEILPFKNEIFDFIISHHSLEHMINIKFTLVEWLRVIKHGCKIAIVMPDGRYGPFGDQSHVSEMSADQFLSILKDIESENKIKILEHDTFQNHFSYNSLIEKI